MRRPRAARRSDSSWAWNVCRYSSTSLCTMPSWVTGRSRTAKAFSSEPAFSWTFNSIPQEAPSAATSRPI